jgi:hypothetical protein
MDQHSEGHRHRRTDGRAQNPAITDPYQIAHKPKEPAICRECGLTFHAGRWQWPAADDSAASVAQATCPACRRIHDRLPAGLLTISCAAQDREQILGLVRTCETAEKADHPLARIMAIEPSDDGAQISTTDTHLPVRIGKALDSSFRGGKLHVDHAEDAYFVRVGWTAPGKAS